jgi:hypothetical protein
MPADLLARHRHDRRRVVPGLSMIEPAFNALE